MKKLEQIVPAMMNNGYMSEADSFEVLNHDSGLIEINFMNGVVLIDVKCFEQLLASPDAMKAIWKKGRECMIDMWGKLDIEHFCGDCEKCMLYMAEAAYHRNKALDILWEEGQEKAIDYLYENLKGEKDEQNN